MNFRRLLLVCPLALVLGAAGVPAIGQTTTTTTTTTVKTITIENWANETAARYDGRVPRNVYLDEMGRRYDADGNRVVTRERYISDWRDRWDAMDRDGRGLSPAEVSRLTGNVDSSTSGMPKSGAGVQPGNMGPASSKGQ